MPYTSHKKKPPVTVLSGRLLHLIPVHLLTSFHHTFQTDPKGSTAVNMQFRFALDTGMQCRPIFPISEPGIMYLSVLTSICKNLVIYKNCCFMSRRRHSF